jgi:sulfoxide reductase heme-binding subunit YedZ
MSVALASLGPSAYWYLARGTGAVALLLLTASVVLGVLGPLRFAAARWPRFAVDTLHRDVSLLVMVLLVVHIATSVLDSFAPIALSDAVIPFGSSYRPLWMGLGALSFDILLALVVTSLLRRRLGYGRWRAIHWLAYASWPVAVLHGLGTGSDTKVPWMLALTIACTAAVLCAVWVRIARATPERPAIRLPATALSIITPLGLVAFTLAGPLESGWAARAGTPAKLLGKKTPAAGPGRGASAASGSSSGPGSSSRAASGPGTSPGTASPTAFSATLKGKVRQTVEPGGAVVDLSLNLVGRRHGRLRVRLAGAPIAGGGLSMTGSQVDLIADGLPSVMVGQIESLQGEVFVARVRGSSGRALSVRARLHIDTQTQLVTGRVDAVPVAGGG